MVNIVATSGSIPAGVYQVQLTATSAAGAYSGVTINPASQYVNITVGSNIGGAVPVTPPTAISGTAYSGWSVAFFDDFITGNPVASPSTTSTITTSTNVSSGYNWYYTPSPPTVCTVASGSTAASISNGNTGGGVNASTLGGILHLEGQGSGGNQNNNLSTCRDNGGTYVTASSGVTGKANYWFHGYFECYMQFNNAGYVSGKFPAFWSWSVQGPNSKSPVEIDFMEYYEPNNSTKDMNVSLYDPGGGGGNGGGPATVVADNQWHTYGCLWVNTGGTNYTITYYYDNVQYGPTFNNIEGTSNPAYPDIEYNAGQHMILGAGYQWPIYVDWVRVYTATGD